MSDVNKNELAVDPSVEPIRVAETDLDTLRTIQSQVDSLARYRQEIGRLVQQIGNMREDANKIELELAQNRRGLAEKYNLSDVGGGQWAIDFEKKEFVKTNPGMPVIP